MFIYIGGDSFCSDRESLDHWPFLLAHLLKYKLQGKGFPGQGWWNTRQDLLAYQTSENFDQTKIFVICHTNINRPLMSMSNGTPEFEQVTKTYYTYMENNDISIWQASMWYRELNNLLHGKQVIHISCFRNGQYLQSLLDGTHVSPALINFAQISDGHANHFSQNQNRCLAEQLYQGIVEKQTRLQISF
jgi:hypothetical protein